MLRRLIKPNSAAPDHVVPKYCSMYVFVWRETTRAGWTRSEVSSNNHRLVRVLQHPDSSVSRTGRQDEPLPSAACPWASVRILSEFFFPSQKSLSGREAIAKLQHRPQQQTPFSCRRAANLRTRRQPAKKTSNSTPVGKEGSHRFGKRAYWYPFLFWGNSGPECPLLVSCAFLLVCLLCFASYYQVVIQQAETYGRREENQWRRASSR